MRAAPSPARHRQDHGAGGFPEDGAAPRARRLDRPRQTNGGGPQALLPAVLQAPEQSNHIAYIIKHAVDNDVRTVEVSEEAEKEWVDTIIRMAVMAQEFLENCTPGYYNNEGKPGERAGQNGFYGGCSVEFFRILQEWRAAGGLKGLELF